MSKVIQNKGGIGVGAPYDLPGYEYDPVTDKFKDLATGKSFDKDGGAKLEDNKAFTVDTNGTIVVNPSATYDGMKKVTLSVNVAGGDLENNKDATIDVSAYTEPVEVTPTAGKDGMKKVTVTLSNITSGGMTVVPVPTGSDDLPSWITYDPDPDFGPGFGPNFSGSVPPQGVEISINITNTYLFLTATGNGVNTIYNLFVAACDGDTAKLENLNNAYSQGVAAIAYTDTQFALAGHIYTG